MSAEPDIPSPLNNLSQLVAPVADAIVDPDNSRFVNVGSSSDPRHNTPTPLEPSSAPLRPTSTSHREARDLRDSPPHIPEQYRSTTRIYRPSRSREFLSRYPRPTFKSEYFEDSETDLPLPVEDPQGHRHHRSPDHRPQHHGTRKQPSGPSSQRDLTPIIKRETLAGLPSWPSDLKLSLTSGNWLEWSRHLMQSLAMTQLDEYPLGLLTCPSERSDPIGYRYWNGNDRMILAFMRSHMFSAETQHIATCKTSASAFSSLCRRHEKRSGLTQLQLIQRLMQISFDDNAEHFETKMSTFRDLVYQIESIGQVDVKRLGLLFLLLNLKSSHPAVHDALAPSLMDGTVSVELMEERMHYHFEMRNAHQNQHYLPNSTVALPSVTSRPIIMCPNCKRSGHSVDFCVAPGGKMEGMPMQEAMYRQRAYRDSLARDNTSATTPRAKPGGTDSTKSGSTSGSTSPGSPSRSTLLKLDNDGSFWIGSTRYRPDIPTNATVAEANLSEEPPDWPVGNFTDTELDTSTILLASTNNSDVALLTQPSIPLFLLDSGASSHISCERSDFSTMTVLDIPRRISGVGNSSVFAVGVGTVDIILPQFNACLNLGDVLFAPEARVRLISIHKLNEAGYVTTFQSGSCTLTDRNNNIVADCPPGPSNLYALPDARIQKPDLNAFPSLVVTPNLETWHRRLGHASHQVVLEMARNGVATDSQSSAEDA